jgi:hypothetical protein
VFVQLCGACAACAPPHCRQGERPAVLVVLLNKRMLLHRADAHSEAVHLQGVLLSSSALMSARSCLSLYHLAIAHVACGWPVLLWDSPAPLCLPWPNAPMHV